MMDERHPDDTLFFVAECDYRFYRGDAEARVLQPAWTTEGMQQKLWNLRESGRKEAEKALEAAQIEAKRTAKSRSSGARSSGDQRSRTPTKSPWVDADADAPNWGSPSQPPDVASEDDRGSLTPTVIEESEDDEAAEREEANLSGWQRKPPRHPPSQELLDLVGICNKAAKLNLGNIVWLAWEPATSRRGRKQVPCHGTTLLGMTRHGAFEFSQHLKTEAAAHLDVILSRWLLSPGIADSVGASYLFPTAGSYVCHLSGCEPNLVRESSFGARHVGDGVRGPDARHLCGYQAKGGALFLEELRLDGPGLDWITERPPAHYWDDAYSFELKRRGWVSWDGWWGGPWWKADEQEVWETGQRPWRSGREHWAASASRGPSTVPGEPSSWRGSQWRAQRRVRHSVPQDTTWRDLVRDPDGHRWLGGRQGYSPLSRLQEQLVCDPPNFCSTVNEWMTGQTKNLRRRALRCYKLRLFGDKSEATVCTLLALRPSSLHPSLSATPHSQFLVPALLSVRLHLASRCPSPQKEQAQVPWHRPQQYQSERQQPWERYGRAYPQMYHEMLWRRYLAVGAGGRTAANAELAEVEEVE